MSLTVGGGCQQKQEKRGEREEQILRDDLSTIMLPPRDDPTALIVSGKPERNHRVHRQ